MPSSDLLTLIHPLRRHENPDLWKMHRGTSDEFDVARGLRPGLLPESEVSPHLPEEVRHRVNGP